MTHQQTSDELRNLFDEYATASAGYDSSEGKPIFTSKMDEVFDKAIAIIQAHDDQLYEELVAGQKHCYDCVHEEIGNPDVVPYIPLSHIKTVMKKGG